MVIGQTRYNVNINLINFVNNNNLFLLIECQFAFVINVNVKDRNELTTFSRAYLLIGV